MENLIQLAATKMTEIDVSFPSDTCNSFSTHSCRATTGINVIVVIKNVGKDPQQSLVGCFDEFKLIVEFYTALKEKIYRQYCDTCDTEWPIHSFNIFAEEKHALYSRKFLVHHALYII